MYKKYALFAILGHIRASDLGAIFGDAAVSQLFRHVAAKVLQEPRAAEMVLKTQEYPWLGSLAHIDVLNQLSYKNLSVIFHDNSFDVIIDRFSLLSSGNISEIFWPLGPGEQIVNVGLQLHRIEVRLNTDDTAFSLGDCFLVGTELATSVPGHWIAEKGVAALALIVRPILDSMLCNALRDHIGSMEANTVMRFPVYNLIPEKLRQYVVKDNTTLFYRLRSVKVNDHRMTAVAQLEWTEIMETPAIPLLEESINSTLLEVQLGEDDLITIWLEDGIINELFEQVDWNFEWMNEQLPVTSPVIPVDSRRDRVYLRVVNPDRNLTSVFVSFILTIQAEMRPAFDGGILRTLVQLLDTNVEMEAGAFPRTWGLFMQDLMRGMIMDMLWPEIKNTIEELSYGKGVAISEACGVDPNKVTLNIGEGNMALTSRLALQYLDMEKCFKDLENSLANTSKFFSNI